MVNVQVNSGESAEYTARFFDAKEGAKLAKKGYAAVPFFDGRVYLGLQRGSLGAAVAVKDIYPGCGSVDELNESQLYGLFQHLQLAADSIVPEIVEVEEYLDRFGTAGGPAEPDAGNAGMLCVGGRGMHFGAAALLGRDTIRLIQERFGGRTFFATLFGSEVAAVVPEDSCKTLETMILLSRSFGMDDAALCRFILYWNGSTFEVFDV